MGRISKCEQWAMSMLFFLPRNVSSMDRYRCAINWQPLQRILPRVDLWNLTQYFNFYQTIIIVRKRTDCSHSFNVKYGYLRLQSRFPLIPPSIRKRTAYIIQMANTLHAYTSIFSLINTYGVCDRIYHMHAHVHTLVHGEKLSRSKMIWMNVQGASTIRFDSIQFRFHYNISRVSSHPDIFWQTFSRQQPKITVFLFKNELVLCVCVCVEFVNFDDVSFE